MDHLKLQNSGVGGISISLTNTSIKSGPGATKRSRYKSQVFSSLTKLNSKTHILLRFVRKLQVPSGGEGGLFDP